MNAHLKNCPGNIFAHFAQARRILLTIPMFLFAASVASSVVADPVAEADITKAGAQSNSKTATLDPRLWSDFLRETKVEVGKPQIFLSRYNLEEGLFVGYQSETGKRILFRSRQFFGIGMSAQVLHFDPALGKVVELVGRSKSVDENGKRIKDVNVGGIDIRSAMQDIKTKSRSYTDKQQQLTEFATNDAGRALLDGVPALYAALEGLEADEKTAKLLEPFGSVVLMLQLTSQQFRGFQSADKVLDQDKLAQLKAACGDTSDCVMRGKRFTVHRFGLFDPLSKQSLGAVKKTTNFGQSFSANPILREAPISSELNQILNATSSLSVAGVRRKEGNGFCYNMTGQYFGGCGPGSLTPGNVWTPQCYGHDYCVCAYSNLECVNEVPANCGVAQNVPCYSLWEATVSWFDAIWDMVGQWWTEFWAWVESWFEQPPACPPNIICQT
jgi:hypothetical protein